MLKITLLLSLLCSVSAFALPADVVFFGPSKVQELRVAKKSAQELLEKACASVTTDAELLKTCTTSGKTSKAVNTCAKYTRCELNLEYCLLSKVSVSKVKRCSKASTSEAELNCLTKKTVFKAPRKACGGLAPYAEITCLKF